MYLDTNNEHDDSHRKGPGDVLLPTVLFKSNQWIFHKVALPHRATEKSGMHAPPRAKMAAPARPDPEKFQHCPAPPQKKIVLSRPENIDRMFRGKVRGKCSYITKRFCESKTFEQYFLAPKVLLVAPKVLLEDIQIPPIHF